jgi:protein SCO1/2
MPMTRRRLAFVAFAVFDVLLVAVLAVTWVARSNLLDERALSELGVARIEQSAMLDDFRLTDQQGRPFTRSELVGKWQFIFFGFTSCPDICPLTMGALQGMYQQLEQSGWREDTGVIMVSVDPLRDTPEVMGDYLQSFHPEFVGLTGEYPQIAGLASQLFVAFSRPGEHGTMHSEHDYVVAHSDYVALIDPAGRHRAILHAPHYSERLVQAYRALRGDD